MGQGMSLRTMEEMMKVSIGFINEQIKSVDWNKKFKTDYPDSERAKTEQAELKKPENKETLKSIFGEHSLALSEVSH